MAQIIFFIIEVFFGRKKSIFIPYEAIIGLEKSCFSPSELSIYESAVIWECGSNAVALAAARALSDRGHTVSFLSFSPLLPGRQIKIERERQTLTSPFFL
jgi:hypothetical protein